MPGERLKRFGGPNNDILQPDPVDIPPPLPREIPIRVAVLAEGAITPLGNSADETWEGYKAGRTGITEHFYPPYTDPTLDDQGNEIAVAQIRAVTAGTIKNFNPLERLVDTGFMPRKEVKFKLERYALYALAASYEALSKVRTREGVGLLIPRIDAEGKKDLSHQWIINRDLVHPLYFSTFVGTGFGGGDTCAEVLELLKIGRIPDDHMMRSLADRAGSSITQAIGANGGAEANTAACASFGKAEEDLIYRIISGASEVGLAIGTEGVLGKPIASAMFDALETLDRGKDPLKVSRSLHQIRCGFTIGEGAVAFVLADPDWARRHGIPILYEIVGVGDTSGAGGNTDPNRIAQEQAMRFARRRAEIHGPIKGKVINSGHYTGTYAGEISEISATGNVLDDVKEKTIIHASKRLAGHILGGAGGLSQFNAGRALQEGTAPGTPFDGEVMDEAYGWDIPKETRSEPDLTDAVVNQFGFGDANVSFWLRKVN